MKLAILFAAFVAACSPAATEKPACSKAAALALEEACVLRIMTECSAGDRTCPAYVECSKAAEQWRTCQ